MSVVERERVEEAKREVTEADVLHRAADLLEEFGWCQGDDAKDADGRSLIDPTSPRAVSFCVGGAYTRACDDLGRDTHALSIMHLKEVLGVSELFVYLWNDRPGRTKQEVVSALRSAAEGTA